MTAPRPNCASPQMRRDIQFSVPLVHRLRFTRDVFGTDAGALLELLETADDQPAQVQFWIDSLVAEAHPELEQRIFALARQHSRKMQLAGNMQIVPGGEAIKNDVHVLEQMLKVLHAHELDRQSYVVVVGGGAMLDAVGFAAAIAHRGMRLIRVPTTTLAQADSGIGVKNGVNLFQQKNWIGTFAVPWGVINDAALLESLSDRDFICGFVEAVKVSLLKDATLFEDVCRLAPRIRRRKWKCACRLFVARPSCTWITSRAAAIRLRRSRRGRSISATGVRISWKC